MLDGYFAVERPKKSLKYLAGALLIVGLLGVAAYSYSTKSTMALQQFQLEAEEFKSYMTSFGKEYSSEAEYTHRFRTFRDNLAYIRVFNSMNNDWALGVNHFADLTSQEFGSLMNGYIPRNREMSNEEFEAVSIPASVDWTTKGAVTGVKNQASCGSCWAFSAIGAVEGAWFLAGHPLVSLSEQQLVSCSGSYGNQGCNGGLMDNAFKYIIAHGGINSEASYPYTSGGGSTGTCNSALAATSVAKISGFTDVTVNNPVALETAIAQQPVSVAVQANQAAWQLYKTGTVSSNCGTALDHGVLAVGYNTSASPPYYKVKNSWGPSWGMSGYIQIAIVNGAGVCGIQMDPSYPKA